MRILTPCAYFYPEFSAASAGSKDLVDEYVRSGIVSVNYAPVPSRGISDEVRNAYKKKKYEEFRDGYVILHRFSMFKEGQNPALRALRYLLCTVMEYFLCIKEKGIDEVYGGSTPPTQGMLCALVAKKLSKKYGRKVPFVYNLQDIFPDSLVGAGLTHKGSLIWKVGRKIEDYTYRHADKIIVISEGFKQNIMAKGVPEEKIEVVYNWVDHNAVKNVPREENKLFDKYGLDRSKFYVEYSGNIGLTQNMDLLVEVVRSMADVPDLRVVLIGQGAYKARLIEKLTALYGTPEQIHEDGALSCGPFCLLPFQPYGDICHVFSLGDVGLVISKPGVGANSVPSKTWSIMSASRPVLASFDEGELKEIIEGNAPTDSAQAPCGIFTKAGDTDGFVRAITSLASDPSKCEEMGRNGRKFVLANLTKEIGTAKYIKVMNSVVCR